MIVQLAHTFLDFLCLAIVLNLGKPVTKNSECSIVKVHTSVVVCGCGVKWNCSRHLKILTTEKHIAEGKDTVCGRLIALSCLLHEYELTN